MMEIGLGLLTLRVVLGLVLILHGLAKLGWLPGTTLANSSDELRHYGFVGGPAAAIAAGGTQALGGMATLVGFLTPVAATAAIGVMVQAVILKRHDGFWAHRGGFEYPLVVSLLGVGLAFAGAGAISLDHLLGIGHLSSPALSATAIGTGVISAVIAYVALHRPDRVV